MTLNEGDRSRSSTMSAFDAFGQKSISHSEFARCCRYRKRKVLCEHAGALAN